jgi:hypothetical protein
MLLHALLPALGHCCRQATALLLRVKQQLLLKLLLLLLHAIFSCSATV